MSFFSATRHKYGAKPVTVCRKCDVWHQAGPFAWTGACINCRHTEGLRFASQAEAKRYGQLSAAQRRGEITGLELQPRFPLVVNGTTIATYVGDFSYRREGARTVEDVKGVETAIFKLKRKLLLALLGVEVVIVR